jgi:hypothetical protein
MEKTFLVHILAIFANFEYICSINGKFSDISLKEKNIFFCKYLSFSV